MLQVDYLVTNSTHVYWREHRIMHGSFTIPGTGILSGNSIGTDKRFLAKYIPAFTDYLHYRIVDVSTVKELCR